MKDLGFPGELREQLELSFLTALAFGGNWTRFRERSYRNSNTNGRHLLRETPEETVNFEYLWLIGLSKTQLAVLNTCEKLSLFKD